MFLYLSVILFTREVGSLYDVTSSLTERSHVPLGEVGSPIQGVSVWRWSLSRGLCLRETLGDEFGVKTGLCDKDLHPRAQKTYTPTDIQWLPLKLAVRILLECILVS